MRIALDFDGVIVDTLKLWTFEFNKRYPSKKITIKDIDEWDFYTKKCIDISREEAFDIFDFCWRHQEFLKSMERNLDYKIAQINTLGKMDIVTAVVKNKDGVKKWLSRKGLGDYPIVFDMEKWNLNYDVYIDDSPMITEHVVKLGKTVLLVDQLWNKTIKTNGKIKRVYGLGHAYDVLKGLKTTNNK